MHLHTTQNTFLLASHVIHFNESVKVLHLNEIDNKWELWIKMIESKVITKNIIKYSFVIPSQL